MIAILKFLQKIYRKTFSLYFGEVCRFHPSCSDYAVQALESRGFFVGSFLTLRRLLRCQPWCEGGFDPVPPKHSAECLSRIESK